LELRERLSLTENTSIRVNRAFFLGGGYLTNGYDLAIETNELIVSDVSIRSRAPTPLDGAHILTNFTETVIAKNHMKVGSKILISAKVAIGKMIVGMIGANGRKGESGAEIENKLFPKKRTSPDPIRNGKNGLDAISVMTQRPCSPLNSGLDISCDIPTARCDRQPTNGTDGLRGDTGQNGGPGQQGGNTGTVDFFIDDHVRFKADIIILKGEGGPGGPPGPGYPGGKGGRAGKTADACGTAVDGIDGQVGPPGVDGKAGDNGDMGPFNGNGVRLILDEYKKPIEPLFVPSEK
jgi:hypothetical protein